MSGNRSTNDDDEDVGVESSLSIIPRWTAVWSTVVPGLDKWSRRPRRVVGNEKPCHTGFVLGVYGSKRH
jgi:hypothetical protein